ncbi:hypothetical protein AAL_06485 [Moelleriella libera RCEF 2490]|uniref:Uncharacterized protein n=1 Tax=Moelleriella libera RCEF 2490 TaxID=1081109 RepID=A0A167YT41_9HYPO|nr:hypothetical protein AAL_06485 [Moelleriella libera RCEF 2490]
MKYSGLFLVALASYVAAAPLAIRDDVAADDVAADDATSTTDNSLLDAAAAKGRESSIGESAQELADQIKKGNGLDIAKGAIDLAGSIVGSIGKGKRE